MDKYRDAESSTSHWVEWIYRHPLFRYVISGSIAASAIFVLLALQVELLSVPPLVASTVCFVVGSLINYSLQYHWTFQADGPHSVMFVRFSLVTLATMTLNIGLFWVFTEVFQIHYLIAQGLAIGLIVVVNFLINKHYTFAADA